MCSGLAYLESMSVCHRDIALRNMLVDKVNDKLVVKVIIYVAQYAR